MARVVRISLAELGLSLHPGQREVLRSPARFKVVCAGRRWGKSHLACVDAVFTVLSSPTPLDVWVISPTHNQGEEIWNKALGLFMPVSHSAFAHQKNPEGRLVTKVYRSVGYRHIELYNGSRIYFRSGANPSTLRGGGSRLGYIIFDEAAYLPDSVWRILRVSLVDKLGRAIFISTPNEENPKNWFYERFIKGLPTIRQPCLGCDGEGCEQCNNQGYIETPNPEYDPQYQSWLFTSFDNPYIPREDIERLIEEENFTYADIQREIYAKFFETEGAVFTLEMITNCEKGEFLPPQQGCTYSMGVDFGQIRDYTVVCVINDRTAHLDYIERFQGNWDVQFERVAAIYHSYFEPLVYIDASQVQGSVIEEELRKRGVANLRGQKINADVKRSLIEGLRVAIERGELTFPPDRTLRTELLSYMAVRLPSGRLRYTAPRGGFDDCVDALALAWAAYRAKTGAKQYQIRPFILGVD